MESERGSFAAKMHGGRTRLRQELMKQALELERQRDEDDARRRRNVAVTQESSTISVPSVTQTPMAGDVTLEVPNDVLKVRTQLAHPTNYHVSEMQRKQVQQFLTQHGTPIQTRSAPAHNLTGFGMPRAASLGGAQKDPLLSGAMGASGSSPLKPNSFNPTMGSPIKHSPVNPSMHSPGNAGSFGAAGTRLGGGGGGMFGNPPPNNLVMKSESPTMMVDQHTPEDIQEQIIEDIMGLEEKFGDYAYLESGMMAPQTLPATTNLFDSFGVSMNMVNPNGPAAAGGAGAGPLVIPQMSASCPTNVKEERDLTMMHALNSKQFEKERQKKNNHNAIERRRRFNINDRIKELGMLLPPNETEARQNKGTILKASVEYIRKLQRDLQKLRIQDAKQRQLEETNRQMRMRIQELELTARAHGIPTPSLNPETIKLAEAADQALGSMTPTSKSPSSAAVTPVNIFGNDELADILRASPGIDLSKLQIKQEPVDSPSSHLGDNLSPSPAPRPSSGGPPFNPQHQQQQQAVGDIFSFNIPMSNAGPSAMPSAMGMETSAPNTNSSTVQFFSNT